MLIVVINWLDSIRSKIFQKSSCYKELLEDILSANLGFNFKIPNSKDHFRQYLLWFLTKKLQRPTENDLSYPLWKSQSSNWSIYQFFTGLKMPVFFISCYFFKTCEIVRNRDVWNWKKKNVKKNRNVWNCYYFKLVTTWN